MNSNKEEGMTNEISLKDLKNIKHRNNFYVGVMNHVSSPCLFMCSNKTSLELRTVLFLFFKNPSSQIGGAAYTWTFTVCIIMDFCFVFALE